MYFYPAPFGGLKNKIMETIEVIKHFQRILKTRQPLPYVSSKGVDFYEDKFFHEETENLDDHTEEGEPWINRYEITIYDTMDISLRIAFDKVKHWKYTQEDYGQDIEIIDGYIEIEEIEVFFYGGSEKLQLTEEIEARIREILNHF